MKFHHLIPTSPYTVRFIALLAAHPDAFPPNEHCFWIEHPGGSAFQVEARGGFERHDVGPWGFRRALQRLGPRDRVVIHQLSNPRLLLHLFFSPTAVLRCAWSIWGGDVYYDRYRPRTWPHALRERLRRAVIPAIPVVSSMVPGDFDVVREVYGSRARYVQAFYPIPMDHAALVPAAEASAPKEGATVLVGNSGDPSNAHEWVFDALARFRDQGVRVIAPLAYGNPAHVAAVIARGRELFGDRFTPLTEFLPAEQYSRLIRDVDAAIMNHGFQQALGNIIALLLLGRKVYVRGDTTPYPYFRDLGVRVEDTRLVAGQSLAEITAFSAEDGVRNSARVREHLSEANAVAGWRRLLDALRATA
jgi:hypothetical protein